MSGMIDKVQNYRVFFVIFIYNRIIFSLLSRRHFLIFRENAILCKYSESRVKNKILFLFFRGASYISRRQAGNIVKAE